MNTSSLYRRKTADPSAGFTIAEVLVSIAVFALVAAVAVSVFVRVLRTQRSVVALITVSDNASIALEQVMRELRFGTHFTSDSDTEVRFCNQDNRDITYKYDPSGWAAGQGALMRKDSGDGFFPVTARNVQVEGLRFALRTKDPVTDRTIPARITIAMTVGTTSRDLRLAKVPIQTTVSERGINNPPTPCY